MDKKSLLKNLEHFGLNEKEALVYLTLFEKGDLSLLELSRLTGINRTTLYRIAEKLQNLGLVEEVVEHRGIRLQASPPEVFRFLVQEKEKELEEAKKKLPLVLKSLDLLVHPFRIKATKVVYYKGVRGLRQVLWNTLRAKYEIVGYGYLNWNESVGKKFAEQLRREIVKRKIYNREIQNENYQPLENFTEVKDYKLYYQRKIIPASLIEFTHDTYIYNDVCAYYYFYEGELFGLEIYNEEIAKTQKQIFYALWNHIAK